MSAFAGKSVLLVDDQHTVTTLVGALLQRLGFATVQVAHDGQQALARLAEGPVDLVISDILMEPMGGLALTKAIRADAANKGLTIILTTSSRDPNYVLAAKRVGADACLTKPFTPAALTERLGRLSFGQRAA